MALTSVQNVTRDVDSKAELIRLLITHARKIAYMTPREQVLSPRLYDDVDPSQRTIQSILGRVRVVFDELSVYSHTCADRITENDSHTITRAIAAYSRIVQ